MEINKARGSCGKPESGGGNVRQTAAQRVFETARALFYQRGVRAVGVDEIVAQAGVTKPSLYRSFASKDELVAACLRQSSDDALTDLDEKLLKSGDDPRAQLRAYIDFYAEKLTRPDFQGCPLSNTAVEFREPGHPGRLVLETSKGAMRERLTGITRRLPTDDPATLADGLLLLIEGAYSSHHIFGSQGPGRSLVKAADALIASFTIESPSRIIPAVSGRDDAGRDGHQPPIPA